MISYTSEYAVTIFPIECLAYLDMLGPHAVETMTDVQSIAIILHVELIDLQFFTQTADEINGVLLLISVK